MAAPGRAAGQLVWNPRVAEVGAYLAGRSGTPGRAESGPDLAEPLTRFEDEKVSRSA